MPITIRTGDIVRADQGKKLYKIVYSLSPYLEDYAVPINGLHTLPDTSGITYCESFSIGDHVIYLCPDSDTYMTNRVGWIIGRVPKDRPYTDSWNSEDTSLFTGMSGLSANLTPLISEVRQDAGFGFLTTYNARENFPVDVAQGDYTLRGENTVLNLSDYNTIIRAGDSEIFLDSILGVLTQTSNLYNRYTLGESTRTQCYKGRLVYTKQLTGDVTNGSKTSADAVFCYREQFSDLIDGYREEILDAERRPIAQINKNIDGAISIASAKGIFIGRSPKLDNYRLGVDAAVVPGDAIEYSDGGDRLAPIKEDENWKAPGILDGSYDPGAYILDMVDEDAWEAGEPNDTIEYTDASSGSKHKVTKAESGIDFAADGSIIIRDAWGSEIRMDHGNIQIAAANNMTTIAGRDQLSIVSGVSAITAGDGIELGSGEGDIAMKAGGSIRCAADEEFTISADSITEHAVKNKVAKYNSVFTEARRAENRIAGPLTTVATGISIVGENSAIISTRSCGLTLAANAVSIGATVVDIYSTLRMNKGEYTIKDVPTVDYRASDISIQKPAANIIVGGNIMTEGSIACNQHVQAAGGMYAEIVAAHDAPSFGMYRLKHAPKKQKNLKTKTDAEFAHSANRASASVVRGMFKESIFKDIAKVFRTASNAFKIIQPLFSIYKGKENPRPATCSTEAGGISYIYPGKNFWTKDGMVTVNNNRYEASENDNIVISGCSQLRLNTPSNIEEED